MATFKTTIELAGKTATGMQVPPKVVAALGPGKRPPVSVTINGYTYRSTIAVYGDDFFLPVAAEVRKKADVEAGDTVTVTIERDDAPRTVDVPADLAKALRANGRAKTFFAGLSYSNQRRYVLQIEAAKKPETRARRIEKTVAALQDGRAQG